MEVVRAVAAVSAGLVLVALAVVDLAWTTLAAGSGAGPLTSRFAGLAWRTVRKLTTGRDRHRRLSSAGLLVVAGVLGVWLLLVAGGWALVFHASDAAVVDAAEGRPASIWERLYFTGYTMFTLGNGEFVPGTAWSQAATVAATLTGLVLVTQSITFLVPVASAVTERRQLASYIASLGRSPEAIVTSSWTGSGFGSLTAHLVALTPLVHRAGQQHLAYPMLHYFHSATATTAAAPALVVLDDALLLLAHGVAPQVRPDRGALDPLRDAISSFLGTLEEAYIERAAEPPPPPTLAPLRAAGVPVVDGAEFAAELERGREHRRLLRGLLDDETWEPERAREL